MERITHTTKRVVHSAVKHEKIRFGLVGLVNTAVDFILLNLLADFLGLQVVVANIISTTLAMLLSFGLNKKAVFRSDGGTAKQFILFMTVTLGGLWLVQTTVLALVHGVLVDHGLSEFIALNIGKLIGICFGLVWNYLWYSRVVFKESDS